MLHLYLMKHLHFMHSHKQSNHLLQNLQIREIIVSTPTTVPITTAIVFPTSVKDYDCKTTILECCEPGPPLLSLLVVGGSSDESFAIKRNITSRHSGWPKKPTHPTVNILTKRTKMNSFMAPCLKHVIFELCLAQGADLCMHHR